MYTTLLTSLENGIYTITINRPDKLNALNRQVFIDLNAALDEIEKNKTIKAVIITGSGNKAFVAGADITEFVGLSAAEGKAVAKNGQDTFFRIENSTKPVLACVNGFALGGGCELAMSCHFRIASEQARFGQPEINLGIIPGYGGTQRLTQLIGKGRAMEMILSGTMIDAVTALQYGLINKITSQEELLTVGKNLLDIIIQKSPLAIGAAINAINAAGCNTPANGYEIELTEFATSFATNDMKEGTAAFLEKRKAHFTGE